MKAQGVKGFQRINYAPKLMGEYILENLLGIDKMKEMSEKQKEDYKRKKYPVVMTFFKIHNLQPTLSNLRLNKEGILTFENGGSQKASETQLSNLSGDENPPGVDQTRIFTTLGALTGIIIILILVKV